MELFFNYSIDCETPPNTDYTGPERRPFFSGPPAWAFAEAAVRGFVERMSDLGAAAGTSLFVYPDVARHQKKLYREMADHGVEIGLHLNGLRYSKLRGGDALWLGEMNCDQQRRALAMGKRDLEDTLGRPCLGYRACYGSSNDDTFPICEALGFTWTSNVSSRCRPEFFSDWSGSERYGHHTNRHSKASRGDMALYEIPMTVGIGVYYDESLRQPLDLRAETPPAILGEGRRKLRRVIEENIVEMDRRREPLRAIIGFSHNTSLFGDRSTPASQNLDWVVRHARELSDAHGHTFTPASFAAMSERARR